MAGITLEVAQAQLELWLAADAVVSKKQEYQVEGRTWRAADAAEISRKIDYWNGWVQRLASSRGGGMRVRGVTPV